MTNPEIIAERKKYGSSAAMDYTMRVYQKLDEETIMIDGVKYQKVEEPKSPVEKAYKDWWGQYPELETDSEYDDTRWKGFKAGFHFAYEEKLKEDDYCDEVGCDEKDNPKPMDEVVNRLIKKHQAQKLFNRLVDELGYDFDACNDIVDLVESWLPKEHDTNSDGWNKCVRMLRENIR